MSRRERKGKLVIRVVAGKGEETWGVGKGVSGKVWGWAR